MSKKTRISFDERHAAASQEVSTRLSLRDTSMFGFVSLSIAIFGIVFSSKNPNFYFLLIIIPFASFGASMIYRYHDETLGLLSLFMCHLELDNKADGNYWHAQKGEWQTIAHRRGKNTLRIAQYLFFVGIPLLAIMVWIYFNSDILFIEKWNIVALLTACVAFIFSTVNIIKSTRFRTKLSDSKKLIRKKR